MPAGKEYDYKEHNKVVTIQVTILVPPVSSFFVSCPYHIDNRPVEESNTVNFGTTHNSQ